MSKLSVVCVCILVQASSLALGQGGFTMGWVELYADNAPAHRQGHLILAAKDRLYVFGGNDGARVIDDFWSFDSAREKWTQLGLPEEITFLNLAEGIAHNGKLYIVGQYPGRISPSASTISDYLDALLVYDMEQDLWERTLAFGAPPDRVGGSFVGIGKGKALLFGGSRHALWDWERVNETWLFDAATRSWQVFAARNPPSPRSVAAIAADQEGNVLLFGGLGIPPRSNSANATCPVTTK